MSNRTPEARGHYSGPRGRGIGVYVEDCSGPRRHVLLRMCERLRDAVDAAEPGDTITVKIKLNQGYTGGRAGAPNGTADGDGDGNGPSRGREGHNSNG